MILLKILLKTIKKRIKTMPSLLLRLDDETKKKLDDLSLARSSSLNQTLVNLIHEGGQNDELKQLVFEMKEQMNLLTQRSEKQHAVLVDLVKLIHAKGV